MMGGIRTGTVLVLAALALNVNASQNGCSVIGLKEAFPPVMKEGVKLCFLYTETPPDYEGQKSKNPDGIAVYSVAAEATPTLVYEFPYAGTIGELMRSLFGKVL